MLGDYCSRYVVVPNLIEDRRSQGSGPNCIYTPPAAAEVVTKEFLSKKCLNNYPMVVIIT